MTATDIGITANAGIVAFESLVESSAEKYRAETAAVGQRHQGMAKEIAVRLPFDTQRIDDEIAVPATERLTWEVRVPPGAVKVEFARGWITSNRPN